ncbi:Coenzyme F420 hydrogenase/dehydrogenase, beta subunit C-terminal domain [Microbacterium sp. XT11]|uniref:Coenzyme F420 hydrogenase/dehydrogenase, beta subunit C-terminal domain n=1 Tax=Microbacterium sp. XT11 TaxID=367477 RepID=UPI00082C25C2|nr:Coenzyme F420 hydrogenase/dehydrogenase, beta subunit C-terminal domain [Microbacterium sp. XT11]
MTTLQERIADVVSRDACSGCGLCPRLDPGVRMQLDDRGYLRPVLDGESAPVDDAVAVFDRSCPGMRITAPEAPADAEHDALLGPNVGLWQAWATDEDVRKAGSSGGALTALHAWLLETGRAARITGAAAERTAPRRTVPVTITTRDQALAAAGSRYAPVGALENPDAFRSDSAVAGKPCEIAALRAAAPDVVDGEAPLLLSFFCAGTPSQKATDSLLDELGIAPDRPVDALRYRGNGWPGRFTARSGDTEVSADYDESWGRVLGPTTQWRCKICPDGVGQAADIVCADSWETDERGYPTFAEGDGISALIARTARGRETILAAVDAGVIAVRALNGRHLRDAQPLQTARRRFLFARLLGSRLAGRRPPRYRGFGLIRLTVSRPREAVRVMRGTFRRVRAARQS